MKEVKDFLLKYRGAIIGALIAIVLIAVRFYLVLIWIALVVVGIFARKLCAKQ